MKKILLIITTALLLCACGGGSNKEFKADPTRNYTSKELTTMSAHEIADIFIAYSKGMIGAYKSNNKSLAIEFDDRTEAMDNRIAELYAEGKISDNDMATIYDLVAIWILDNAEELEETTDWMSE